MLDRTVIAPYVEERTQIRTFREMAGGPLVCCHLLNPEFAPRTPNFAGALSGDECFASKAIPRELLDGWVALHLFRFHRNQRLTGKCKDSVGYGLRHVPPSFRAMYCKLQMEFYELLAARGRMNLTATKRRDQFRELASLYA